MNTSSPQKIPPGPTVSEGYHLETHQSLNLGPPSAQTSTTSLRSVDQCWDKMLVTLNHGVFIPEAYNVFASSQSVACLWASCLCHSWVCILPFPMWEYPNPASAAFYWFRVIVVLQSLSYAMGSGCEASALKCLRIWSSYLPSNSIKLSWSELSPASLVMKSSSESGTWIWPFQLFS